MPKHESSPADPMELVGVMLPTETDTLISMVECVIEEFVKIGWDEDRLIRLFRNPFYQGTHLLYRLKGEEYARHLIRTIRKQWGFDRAREESDDAESL